MTPNDIILQALKESGVLGVGQVASAEDVNDCFFRLNLMLGQWSKKRWLVYHLVDVAKVGTGAVSYTVGPTGDFNIPRADKVESAFVRLLNNPNPTDYPLWVTNAREDYNRVCLKSMSSFPDMVFYDADYPMGHLYVWPLPNASYEIHITVKETLTQFTALNQVINLPPEYMGAIFYNLAARLRSAWQLPPDPSIVAFAKDALGTLRQANTQVPEMTLPRDLVRHGRAYNIYSDQ